ncbi:beta-N-acetylhexosaminidase [Arenicella xantha]|uniref:beta-N-acetylhexosaminidase n=1 Tax=Arenicella xantha TaxID=644221 RepID=A0A395JK83_9GAMM|nr:beta-N-acetylhexosaminidase [Arenicella xantha]RBP50825.1 beta-N-acetylhexosaminidase [Arenicella xantha]
MTYSEHHLPLGPVMVDVAGLTLEQHERDRLLHPSVGAVILFARNYQSRDQVRALIKEIKALRHPALLVSVDQEGGRVQRFQDQFTRLPAADEFGKLWQEDCQSAPVKAFESAFTMASELIDVGVDFSFAPVFDVTSQASDVIGDRCFHADPMVAAELLGAYIDGMHAAGMVAIAKHFPGHGGVSGDSHHCLPTDPRAIQEITKRDLVPYQQLINEIAGVMTAHVLFSACDDSIPTYSDFWLQTVLRQELAFEGVIFSDDLTMQGAIDAVPGGASQDKFRDAVDDRSIASSSIVESAQRAIYAGCDMVLVCNRPDLADELLEGLEFEPNEALSAKLSRLSARESNI